MQKIQPLLFWKYFIPFSANPTKWSNTLKQFISKLLMNCLSVFDHFVGLALQGLKHIGLRRRLTDSNYFYTEESIPCTNIRVRVMLFPCTLRARNL